MVHLQFSLTQLKSDPEATLCSFLFIILAENLTADETESVRVDSKEDNEVCHFLRSVQISLIVPFWWENGVVLRIACTESWNMPDGICLWFHSLWACQIFSKLVVVFPYLLFSS